MKGFKKDLINAAIVSSLSLGIVGVNSINNNQYDIKSRVDDLLNNKYVKVYNPVNPDGIEIDDGYIYIVRSELKKNNING